MHTAQNRPTASGSSATYVLEEGFREVYLPMGVVKKYQNAAKEVGWQYVGGRIDFRIRNN